MNPLWSLAPGRELDASPLEDRARPTRLVACLNVWNDLPALKQTMGSWSKFVHHIIAVDGAYSEMGHTLSTDGTREFLKSLPHVTLLDAPGLSQCDKRSRYLSAGQDGDTLFIVDADEALISPPSFLQALPVCDVGWVRIQSPLYSRMYGQPRLIRWMPGLHYRGRHHWIYQHDALLCTHQYGGVGFEHRPVNLTLHNQRRLGRNASRLDTKHTHHEREIAKERVLSAIPQSVMSDAAIGKRESLQILMHAYRDDGLAPSRLHTAINRTTPHSSVFVKVRPGPFDVPDQYLVGKDSGKLAQAVATADLIHYHGVMSAVKSARPSIPCVFHHHGTLFRTNAEEYTKLAKQRNALVLLSNLELFSWTNGEEAYFLPNTVPVARYAMLRALHQPVFDGSQLFRIAHSPSKPEKKGTDKFLAVCAYLQSKGYPIEPVIIHGQTHRDALRMKATCHAMFDSFWLGMQCSGIEAAAMGLPVIGGDVTVRDRYVTTFGACPYTFAENEEQLEHELTRIIDGTMYREIEASRVHEHVKNYHDESAVALKYLDLLDAKFGWRTNPIQVIRPVRPATRIGTRR